MTIVVPLTPGLMIRPDTIFVPGGVLVADSLPGGGGFGAVMSDAHFKRYKPSDLGPGYRPAYESHLRKQKSGR